jgi:nicotinate phosphoribosyltransferase
VQIFVSGGLDEYELARLLAAGAPIDAAGVGTRLGVCDDTPYLDSVYKLVAYDGRPVMKFSVGKETLPGAKQVFRFAHLTDQIGLRHESVPDGATAILEPVMSRGRRLRPAPPLSTSRALFEHDLADLSESARDLSTTGLAAPTRSAALVELADSLRATAHV